MASTSQPENPSPAACQSAFEQGVALALHLWPVLTQAVAEQWGGPNSADIRDWFAGAVVELFPDLSSPSSSRTTTTTAKNDDDEPEQCDVEHRLLQVMFDEFETNVDDGSAMEVAEQVMRARAECARGRFDAVDEMRRRFDAAASAGAGAKKVVFVRGQDEENETDWDTDDDGDDDDVDDGGGGGADVNMDDAPALVPTPKQKEEPEVDEDGFTKVTRKKR